MMFTPRDRLKLLAVLLASGLSACGGGASTSSVRTVVPLPPPPPPPPPAANARLKDVFEAHFAVGAAITPAQINQGTLDEPIISAQFSSITAENIMKPSQIAPIEGNFNFTETDQLVDYALANGMEVRGHTLLWHRQTPDYFFNGPPAQVRSRLEHYITTVVDRYKGRIKSWDVVNEVASDGAGATAPYRDSNWYQAAGGADYIDWAFNAARAADPDAKLFINDYSTEFSGKRGRLLTIVSDLLDRGLPIDGVGHQFHVNVGTPAQSVFDALTAVENLSAGLINHVTELDISVYEDPASCFSNQVSCRPDYGTALPASVTRQQAELYRNLFGGFKDFSSLESVSLWGVSDAQSWLNTTPVTRTNYPLLFDRQRDAKSAFFAVTDPAYIIP